MLPFARLVIYSGAVLLTRVRKKWTFHPNLRWKISVPLISKRMWSCIMPKFTNQKDKLDTKRRWMVSVLRICFSVITFIFIILSNMLAVHSCGNTSPAATTLLRTRTMCWYRHYCVSADKPFQASLSGHLFSPTVYVKQFDQPHDRTQIQSVLVSSDWAANHKTSFHLGSWHLCFCMFVVSIILTNLTGVQTIARKPLIRADMPWFSICSAGNVSLWGPGLMRQIL